MRRSPAAFLASLVLLLPVVSTSALAQEAAFRFDEIKHRLRIGADQDRLIQELKDAGIEPLTVAQLAELGRLGAKGRLLRELRASLKQTGGDIVSEVVRRAKTEDQESVLLWILRQGRQVRMSRAQMRQMRDAELDLDLQRALAGSYAFPGFRTYTDPLGMLSIQYPGSWRAYEWWNDGGFQVVLSPEHEVPGTNQFATGLQIQVSSLTDRGRLRKLGIVDFHRRTVPELVRSNRGYALQAAGQPVANKLAGRPAVEQDFTAKMLGQACRERLVRTVADDLQFFMEFVAPRKQYDRLAQTRERMLASFRPLPYATEPVRRSKPLLPSAVTARYRSAVVRVKSRFGRSAATGSGFIARADGLVLTNAHVIRDVDNLDGAKMADKVSVLLEIDGRKRELQVEVLDWVYEHKPRVDMALLRLPRSSKPYPTIPISTVRSGRIRVGDPVIALGFPGLGKGDLFLTNGSVTAIKYDTWRVRGRNHKRLDQITIDATIAPGNSGGPCIDLRTGAVIGLNTFVFGSSLYSYSGVSVMDHALRRFPQIRWYPRKRRMKAEEHAVLGAMLRVAGHFRSAKKELELAVRGAAELTVEQRAEVEWQRSLVERDDGWALRSHRYRRTCLRLNPNHYGAALAEAASLAARKKFAQALEILDRIAAIQRNDWLVHVSKAQVYRLAHRYPEALEQLQRASEKAGGVEPAIELAKGRTLLAMGRSSEALAAFLQAKSIAPRDERASLSIARFFEGKKDRSSAAIEYQRMLTQNPESAAAHLARARFRASSTDAAQRKAALDDMLNAVFLEWKSGRSGATYLEAAAHYCTKVPGQTRLGITLAQLLHRTGASRHITAHWILAALWKLRRNPDMSRLHRRRGLVLGAAAPATTAKMVSTMIASGYSPDLLQDTLSSSSLAFHLNMKTLKAFKKIAGFQKLHVRSLLWRTRLDQMTGSRALANGLVLKQKLFLGKNSPYALVTITNPTNVPLTGIRLRHYYKDAKKKVLWSARGPANLGRNPILEPHASRTFTFRYDNWKVLDAKKIRSKIHYYGLNVEQARNADYLKAIRLVGRVDKGVYKVTVVNQSLFRLRRVSMTCEYQIVGQTKSVVLDRNRRPFIRSARISNLNLPRGSTSATYRVPSWPTTITALRKAGALPPRGKNVRPLARLQDVTLQLR